MPNNSSSAGTSAEFLFVLDGPAQGSAGKQLAGSAKTTSLIISIPIHLKDGVLHDELTRLVAHEFYHTWGQARFAPGPDLRWLQEGFCDYYAYLVSARLELLAWSDFSAELGHALGAWVKADKLSEFTLESAGELDAFVHDPHARTLIYRGGMALAALFDRRIREAKPGASLDDFMRALYNDERWSPSGASPTSSDVLATLARFVGDESAAELIGMTKAAELPDLVELFRAAGADIASERHEAPLLFDAELDGSVIVKVTPKGQVEEFGLRAGDELLTVNGSSTLSKPQIANLWRRPREGRLHCSFARDGEALELEGPIPAELLFIVDPRPWRTHSATSFANSGDED